MSIGFSGLGRPVLVISCRLSLAIHGLEVQEQYSLAQILLTALFPSRFRQVMGVVC